jgi:hypothetical protein
MFAISQADAEQKMPITAPNRFQLLFAASVLLVHGTVCHGQDAAALAKELSNPIASLISVPFQSNWEQGIGPDGDGSRYTLNIQPVIPISISPDWNLISRTILPVVDQWSIFPGAGEQFGLSDTVQSLFFSPKEPTAGGLIWGVGPVFLLPTATDDLLGSEQWGAGPTAVGLVQTGPWTIGMLANHIWSFAGPRDRTDINSTFIQPFISYNTPTAWTFTLQTESTYDWEGDQWQIPVAAMVSKVTKIGDQLVQFQAGPRYYAASTTGGPDGWAFRFNVVLLFPK